MAAISCHYPFAVRADGEIVFFGYNSPAVFLHLAISDPRIPRRAHGPGVLMSLPPKVNSMSVCLLFFRRHCASVLGFCLASLTLCISGVSNAQNYNAAVNFTDSQIVAIPNPCNGSTVAFAGRFHRITGMDFIQTCYPEIPPGADPQNAVLLNQNNGIYKPVEDTAIDGRLALPLAVADLNGDGYSDLILTRQFNSTAVGVQISNGDGTFKAPVYTDLSISNQNLAIASVVTGDFNGDGKIDVAVLLVDVADAKLNNTDEVVILQNTGSGGLKQVSSFMLSNLGTDTGLPILAAGKLNGDNNTDLAIAYVRPAGAVVPYFATGSGSFTRGSTIGLNEGPYSIAIGTFTSSGYGDIAVTAPLGIRVFLGSSAGTFTAAPETKYPYPAQVNTGIGLGDFDKDGKLDLAATDGTRVLVYWGAGNGTFSSTVALSEWGSGLIVADMNGDGLIDLAATDFSGAIHILSNLGARNFRGAPATNSPNATGIVVADFNKDGKKDVAVVNTPTCKAPCSGTVSVFPGTGSTYFAAAKKYTIGMHGAAIGAGDVNGDGILDLVVTNAAPGDNADTSVLLGISGGFAAAKNYTLGSLSNVAYLVDMNRDGKLDLVEAGGIALGKGNGTFGPLIPYPDGLAYSSASFASNLYLGVGHFNADSIPDVAIAYNSPDIGWLIYELIGNGTGHFTATQLVDNSALLQSVVGITVGKLTNGGPDDIVVANSVAACCGSRGAVFFGQPAIFFGDGKGNFTESPSGPELTDGLSPGGVVIADFNHDGWPDIGMVSGDQFQAALGQDGTNFNVSQVLSSTTGWNTNQSVGNLASADFNGDGWPDIVTSNTYGITRLYGVPVPLVNPARLDFSVAGSKKITIKNTVTATQAIQVGVAGQAMSSFAITGNTCPASLAPGASCTITVQYTAGVSGHGEAISNLWVRSNGAFIAQIPLVGFVG